MFKMNCDVADLVKPKNSDANKIGLDEFVKHLENPEVVDIAHIRNVVLRSLQCYTQDAGFYQLMPILMSPITDPLNHAVYPAEIAYENRPLRLTASMIFHKQLALRAEGLNKIFIVAPNIRLEKNTIKSSVNHLLEFSQFDFEIKGASMYDVMKFINELMVHVFTQVKTHAADQLERLGRELPDYDQQFLIYSSDELREKHGENFEQILSTTATTPCFITNYKREFYDRETPNKRKHYNNFDLIYPEGYGEALSGAEREFEYEQIIYRMNELQMDLAPYQNYLEAAKRGDIPSTACAGIGIERLLRFICGKREIKDIGLFDRSIATKFLF
jgi:asparaginyl-tRNA synthetase